MMQSIALTLIHENIESNTQVLLWRECNVHACGGTLLSVVCLKPKLYEHSYSEMCIKRSGSFMRTTAFIVKFCS